MKLKDLPLHPPKILLTGDPGAGKTGLALTLGKHARIIDLDNGLRVGLSLKDKFYEARNEVDVYACWEDNPKKAFAFQKARSYIESLGGELSSGKSEVRALVVDSLTTLGEFCLRYVLSNANRLGKSPERQEWGIRDIELQNLFVAIRALPIVVVLTAHLQRSIEDDVTKCTLSLPGTKFPPRIPAYFDEIWVQQVRLLGGDKREYRLLTQSTSTLTARSRDNLPDGTDVNLGLPEILRRIGYDIEKPRDVK